MNIEYCNLKISFFKEVLAIFEKYVQYDIRSLESGGIITGKLYENSIKITNCSEPSNFDNQSRYNFTRSSKSAQYFLNERFHLSGGEEIYLGEWHTHPENIPSPSQTDIKSFKRTLTRNNLYSDIHLMIIVGIEGVYIGIYYRSILKREHTIVYRNNNI